MTVQFLGGTPGDGPLTHDFSPSVPDIFKLRLCWTGNP